ncbi:hypothetical protein [Paradevosia shaoguanensis]|uniref:Uncharacterized protein n=1 Tax=Paradevosia shaoguanensis TaxID=1335043 RepID=A0AA41U9A4_9HYPH|nr:hypothetical protein [Paradevosia shaoguanensis]MCF1740716.1 hypothetical protein [Paradevosia shaoguanensis]MCI0125200.1 hypothetical protein [Paradevosia shaoguanensis]
MTPRIALILGGLFLLTALAAAAYLHGRSAGFEKARIQYETLMAVQEAANRDAIRRAETGLLKTADALATKSKELNDVLDTIDQAADADPDGLAMCLSADSVRRLNAVR